MHLTLSSALSLGLTLTVSASPIDLSDVLVKVPSLQPVLPPLPPQAVPAPDLSAPTTIHIPTILPGQDKFTLFQQPAGDAPSGPQALAQAYSKQGVAPPPQVRASSNDGTVVATNTPFDQAYTVPVVVGSTTLQVIADTGSADLWVFSSLQPASQKAGHTIYTPGQTASSVLVPSTTWSITYIDGAGANGIVYNDTVKVGTTTATSCAVEVAQSASADFVNDMNSNGVLGLGFPYLNRATPKVTPWFFNVMSSLSAPLFTANLKKGKAGSYDFGFIDATKYTGSLAYVAVNRNQGNWKFTVAGYGIGSATPNTNSFLAIADTGTTLLLLPNAIVTAYYAQVSGASYSNTYGAYIYPCSATLPPLSLQIGTYKAILPGTYVNYGPIDQNGNCYGGLQTNGNLPWAILGDIFLKSQFVVFDTTGPRIGFAKQASP